ncbi:MAG: hypothetical protein J4F35_20215 [Candidatus Latescibacteria bacterium]|nr:hypothetical protein [Candidatus Latescibacterota bacterium]
MDLDALLSDVDLDEMLRLYDEAAEELLQVAISDGHFAPSATATLPTAIQAKSLGRWAATSTRSRAAPN